MRASDELLGNFTEDDIKNHFDNLKDDEYLLILCTSYRDIYPLPLFKSDKLDFEHYYLADARPGSPAAKKAHVTVVIKRNRNEFRFPLMGVLGLKIKKDQLPPS